MVARLKEGVMVQIWSCAIAAFLCGAFALYVFVEVWAPRALAITVDLIEWLLTL